MAIGLAAGAAVAALPSLSRATITVTPDGSNYLINNGALSVIFSPSGGDLTSIAVNSISSSTNILGDGSYSPSELDEEFAGTPFETNAAGTTSGIQQTANYVDMWTTVESGGPTNNPNPITYTFHYLMYNNDSAVSAYEVLNHSATDPATSVGQGQFLLRGNPTYFDNTYQVDTDGPFYQGVQATTASGSPSFPSANPGFETLINGSTGAQRTVQNVTYDLTGSGIPGDFSTSTYTDNFFTKYDYSSYEQFHQGELMYGSNYYAGFFLPQQDTMSGGPTKQNLNFTDPDILTGEFLSGHYGDAEYDYVPTQGVATTKLYGPYVFDIGAASSESGAQIYQTQVNNMVNYPAMYAQDTELTGTGIGQGDYIPDSQRGAVIGTLGNSATGAWTGNIDNNTVVLAAPNTNFQESTQGYQYWTQVNNNGSFDINNVVPGTYRMSIYQLGQWGETRIDGVTVQNGQITIPQGATFTPENFSPSAPIWTIGTPNRSSEEFLDGDSTNGTREYYGNYNYWQQEQNLGTPGYISYYATPEYSTTNTSQVAVQESNPATDWIANQWNTFNPGMWDSNNQTSNGYELLYAPAYVQNYTNVSNGVTNTGAAAYTGSPWQVHFVTSQAQQNQGQYVDISVGLAADEGSLTLGLNNHNETFHYNGNYTSGPMYRSGDAGFYFWLVFEFPTSDLKAAGTTTANDNVLTLSASQSDGVMYDALRMEIDNESANPTDTGWDDYYYVTSSGTVDPVDTYGLTASNSFGTLTNGIWQTNDGGSWGNSNTWSNSVVPNAAGGSATFSAAIYNSTITLDGTKTIGSLTLDASSSYTIAAGTGGSLNMASGVNGGGAIITDVTGSHTISAPITLASNTTVSIGAGAGNSMALTGNISGAGALTVTGGPVTLSGTDSYTGGTIINNGASLTLAGAVTGVVAPNFVNNGSLLVSSNITAGSITGSGSTTVNQGGLLAVTGIAQSYVENNGSFNVMGTSTIGSLSGTGTLTIENGGRLVLAATPAFGSNTVNTQASLVLNGSGSTLGTLDITDNTFVVEYSGSSPQTTIRNEIIDGFNDFNWNGPGITSSIAADDAANPNASPYKGNAAIGYADNNDLGNTGIPANSVLIRFTYYGDADLNGKVDLNDFDDWLYGYTGGTDAAGGVSWSVGDFAYTGHVDLNDFDLWLASYTSNLGSLSTLDHAIEVSTLSTSQQDQLLNIVATAPEPASIGLLGMAALGMLPRRRRTPLRKEHRRFHPLSD
ncbi:MAG: polysaccharide lyase family protein [Tepidisphaeraceae bacterium]